LQTFYPEGERVVVDAALAAIAVVVGWSLANDERFFSRVSFAKFLN
jgi:hypothetical protein